MSPLAVLGALVVGAAFGYGARRGAFCMNSGFRGTLEGDWTKVKALGLAVALQLVLLPVLFAAGLARPAHLPLMPVAAVAGGVLFGASMHWAGGCAAGVWYKLGAGDVGALLAILGMALGATATDLGPLSLVRARLQGWIAPMATWSPPAPISVGLGALLLVVSMRLAVTRAGAWTWRRTGLWVGLTSALAWPVSTTAGRDFGLAVVPGTTGLLAGVGGHSVSAWDVALVLGILAGGWLGARRSGPVVLGAPGPALLVKRFAGGLGLGIGASIAAGCTVGQGLTGLPLLAPHSFLVMGSIFAGSTLGALAARRPVTAPLPTSP